MKTVFMIKLQGCYLGSRWLDGIDCHVPQFIGKNRASRFSSREHAAEHLAWVITNYPGSKSYSSARIVKITTRPAKCVRDAVRAEREAIRKELVARNAKVSLASPLPKGELDVTYSLIKWIEARMAAESEGVVKP